VEACGEHVHEKAADELVLGIKRRKEKKPPTD
jgi:hypothetical protein